MSKKPRPEEIIDKVNARFHGVKMTAELEQVKFAELTEELHRHGYAIAIERKVRPYFKPGHEPATHDAPQRGESIEDHARTDLEGEA